MHPSKTVVYLFLTILLLTSAVMLNAKNDATVYPLLEQESNSCRCKQDIDQRLIKLQEEEHQGTFALLYSQAIRPEAGLSVGDFKCIQPLGLIRFEKFPDLFYWQMVPMLQE